MCFNFTNKITFLHKRFGRPNIQTLLSLLKYNQTDNLFASMIKQATQHFCKAL